MTRLLVIEDDKNIALALSVRLRAHGYEVTIAYDTVTGVNAARRQQPDLILLDISMPGGGGLLVAERLRAMGPTAAIPIIFLTASKEAGLRDKAMALGAAAFFEKPYDGEELLGAIARSLGGDAASTPVS